MSGLGADPRFPNENYTLRGTVDIEVACQAMETLDAFLVRRKMNPSPKMKRKLYEGLVNRDRTRLSARIDSKKMEFSSEGGSCQELIDIWLGWFFCLNHKLVSFVCL
jgi:hypothetical protein